MLDPGFGAVSSSVLRTATLGLLAVFLAGFPSDFCRLLAFCDGVNSALLHPPRPVNSQVLGPRALGILQMYPPSLRAASPCSILEPHHACGQSSFPSRLAAQPPDLPPWRAGSKGKFLGL
ncbi:hypothetical protein NDU88_006707 [Pleurodeles waltl]|uniref:Secreted protein n=1 Tax=Pleurodeles waltl TaxID=8319 RepID=A0AAV7TZ57_PLEWA|nr:hypothetical protein NDU88_006707 [Pleurodeles waltl]